MVFENIRGYRGYKVAGNIHGSWVNHAILLGMYYCERCNYSWRSSEESEVTVLKKRDPEFQLANLDLDSLEMLNPIPPLKKT